MKSALEPSAHPGKDRSLWAVTLVVSLTLLALGWLSWTTFRAYRFVSGSLPAISRLEKLHGQVLHFDEVLTMSARMSVETGDPTWEARYRRFAPLLDQALKDAARLAPTVASSQGAMQTDVANATLQVMERRAFELVRQGQQAEARQLLLSGEYDAQKKVYAAGMAQSSRVLEQHLGSVRAQRQVEVRWSVVTAAVATPSLMLAWWFALRAARRNQAALVKGNRQLTLAVSELADFKAALDESAIVAITDPRGKITYVNDKFCAISKYAREELLGQDHRLINSGHHPKAFIRDLWQTIGRGRVWKGEIKNRAKDGAFYWVATTIVPFLDEYGKPVQYIVIRADITERKQAEEHVSQLNTDLGVRAVQLEEANKELESFSYSVSHDLRAPLRHVHGYVEMLQRAAEGQLSDEARRYLKTIADASVEMGQLIDDLLAFSRMGRTAMGESRVDLGALVQETIQGLEMATTGRNVIWQTAPLPAVVGDRSMLKQVLANLVGNAVKYSRMRDPAHIEIGCAGQEDGRVILFVRDKGIGFDMQYADKLFGVFQRLHRAEEFEGTGIGLATVRRIVARHGGRVWAEAAVNHGATFFFTLKPSP